MTWYLAIVLLFTETGNISLIIKQVPMDSQEQCMAVAEQLPDKSNKLFLERKFCIAIRDTESI